MKFVFVFIFLFTSLMSQTSIYESEDVIIYNLDSQSKTIVFWGGLDYATPLWLTKQIPQKIYKKYNIVLLSYKTELGFAKKIFLEKVGYELKPNIILGFSRGGLQAQKNYSKKYEIVGYIDPVLNLIQNNKTYENVIIVFNPVVWGRKYSKTLMSYGKIIARRGGTWEVMNIQHSKFPKYFLKKFI